MSKYKDYSYLNMADEKRAGASKKGSVLELVLFWILPFIVINLIIFFIVTATPKFTVSVEGNNDYKSAVVNVNIKSIFPIKEFTVKLGNEPLEMTNTEKRNYTATVYSNGTLEVSVVNKNDMAKTVYENINAIDDTPPMVTEEDSGPGFCSMHIEDTQSGVNYDSLYAIDGEGKKITPSLLDEGDGLVVFNYDQGPLEVHICDKIGLESITEFP